MNTIRNYMKALVCVVILGLASLSASAQENYVMKIWHDGAVANQYPTTLVDSVTFELGNLVDPGNPISDYPYLWIANLDDSPNNYLLGYYQYMARTDAYTYSINFYAPANNTPVVFVPTHSLSGDKIGISPQSGDVINSSDVLPLVLPQQGYYTIVLKLANKTVDATPYTPSPPSFDGQVQLVDGIFGWDRFSYKLDVIDDFRQTKDFAVNAGETYFYLEGAYENQYRARYLPDGDQAWHVAPSRFCGMFDDKTNDEGDRKLQVTFEAGTYTFTYNKETRWVTISTKH
ncbi:MAG: hypothetical protein LBO74_08370 [Candidatus Symbiothrix sp.]|jgi:hypothetical protein|nr:hypothetical protein [Candidatus Symbiothrix sp.]